MFNIPSFFGFRAAGPLPFEFSVKTDNAGVSTSTQFRMPLITSTGLNMRVDWGDGNIEIITNHTLAIHTYASAGTYIISVTGSILGWSFANGGDRLKMLNVFQWSGLNISTVRAFDSCSNLTASATDKPLITSTSLLKCFESCLLFNGEMSSWDVSNVTDMGDMFRNASSFNQNIGAWDVSKVTNFSGMFLSATAFKNGGTDDIDNWTLSTTSNIDMSLMFGGFNTSQSCKFNRYIGSWNTERVTNMSSMFSNNTAFNQGIGAWNTFAVTNMNNMFRAASSFNQNIGSWNVSNVTDMNNMLRDASSFNQNIGSWNVSNVNNMRDLFNGASLFNQPIGNWDVSNVTNMGNMFSNTPFNQDISSWDVSSVAIMDIMFVNADAFNQDISSWDINQVSNFTNFMLSATGLSTTNYDLLLVGWEANLQALYPSGVGYPFTISINFGGSKYTLLSTAATARASLISVFGWTITDGGGI
jgi:surface protein